MWEIFIGVFSGVLTALILLAIKSFWHSKVSPFLRALRYSGVQISGVWLGNTVESIEENTVTSNTKLSIEQKAHDLFGTCTYEYNDDNRQFILNFDVKGYLWEGYITLNFIPKDKRIMSYATAMMKISGGGTDLLGQFSYRNVVEERVDSIQLHLSRQDRIDGVTS